MRSFHFRAWHKGHPGKKSAHAPQMLHETKPGEVFKWLADGQPLEIMQATGMNTDDGKPIFEGDIIQYDTENGPFVAQVLHDFSDGEERWMSGFTTKVIKGFDYKDDESVPLAVIGNIYENPELLS